MHTQKHIYMTCNCLFIKFYNIYSISFVTHTMIRSCEPTKSPESSLGLNNVSESVHERHLTPAPKEKDKKTTKQLWVL